MASPRKKWSDVPPLAVSALALILLLTVLPSALNLPQSNPSQTLEYAPVPPEDENQPPEMNGNLSSLGLGSSGSVGAGGAGDGEAEGPLEVPGGRGNRPSTKRCVGSPPRQTEDPMSPPCVAFFSGDNGGATSRGVTAASVNAVVSVPGNSYYVTGETVEGPQPPSGTYCNVDRPPDAQGQSCYVQDSDRESTFVRVLRAYSRYFNERYQTYDRRVELTIHWSVPGASAEGRRADAADEYNRVKPFAAISTSEGNEHAYLAAHTSRGVMYFTGVGGLAAADRQPAEYYQRHAPLAWSFDPDVERWVDLYVSYVCRKVKPYPVAHATAGTDATGRPLNGQPRRYAFVSTTDARFPGVQRFAALAKEGLRACGIDGPEYTYPTQGAGIGVDTEGRGVTTVSDMRQRGITTLLWLGGTEPNLANAADDQRYYPEIVVAGDGAVDRNGMARLQRPNFWRNAWLVSSEVRLDSVEAAPWVAACREGDPELTRSECDYGFQFYRKLFMLFKAIQTAGPRLTPRSVDTGMHAIPEIESSSAYLASCYFRPGDFSCVKDGTEEWWDPNGVVDGQRPGCWRMVRGGRRYLAGKWEGGDDVFANPADPCNAFSSSGTLYD